MRKKKLSIFEKGASTLMAGAFLLTNVIAAHAGEDNFWSKRRQAIERTQRPSGVLEVASLPAGLPGPDPFEILKRATALPQDVSLSLSENLAKSLPPGFVSSHKNLFEALPLSLGTVRSVALPKIRPKYTVVYIQDVHLNQDAQKNIAGVVRSLAEKKAASVLALEGAWGSMDLSDFRSFHDHDAVREAADFMLRKNEITGPVHTAFTGPIDFPAVVGVDDKKQYHANVNAYIQSTARKKEYAVIIADARRALLPKKAQVFNKALLEFDRTVETYREGHGKLGDYARAVSIAMTDPKAFPSMAAFLHALRMEESLNFSQVEAERTDLIQKMAKTLKPAQLSSLLEKSIAYRAGQLRNGEFYGSLKNLCAQSGVNLKTFPVMDGYIQYILASDTINADSLFREMNLIEKLAYDKLSKTLEEKLLVAESHRLLLTSKLVDFSLTTGEWKAYEALIREGSNSPLDLSSFESFYRNAISRDESMTKNMIRQMEKASVDSPFETPVGILVTGGFHSEGITTRLQNAGAVVVSFIPKIDRVDTNGSEYLSVFTQQKTPLGKLFSGERLFLGINQTEAEVHIQKKIALIVALVSQKKNERDTIPNRVVISEWDTPKNRIKAFVNGIFYWMELQLTPSGEIMGVLVSPNKHDRTLDYLKNGGKKISEWVIAKIGIFNSNVSRSVGEGIFQRVPILIGFGLSLIFLVYVVFPLIGHFVISLDAIAALAPIALVGGTTTNGASSYLKAIGDNEPLDPKHDGEKAYHLGVLCRLGVNIPPGFALLPSFYINDFKRTKNLSTVWGNVIDSLTQLENKTGQRLGNRNNPIFLSVRSNAGEEESMPGLMKTIVNVGLNQDTFQGLVERDGELFAQDTMRRFIRSYATGVFGIADEEFYLASTDLLLQFEVKEEDQLPVAGMASLVKKYRSIVRAYGKEIPEDGHEQLKESLKAVLKSFDSESARIFKKVRGLTDVGMGAIVQKMVFGNLNDRSGSGVVFTRNRRTGKNTLDGQYGIKIQGEDVVSGRPTTGLKNVENLKTEMPGVYESLLFLKNLVENKFGWPQDLEFTIQKGELFILQARDAELSPEALLKAGGDMVEEGIIPSDVFMVKKAVTMAQTKVLYHLRPDFQGTVVMKGKYGTPGAQRGRMMFSDNFNPSSSFEAPVIIVENNPNAPALLKTLFSPDVCGLLTMEASKVSHAAIRCQSSGMPSVMGISGIRREGNVLLLPDGGQIHEGDWIVVDGDKRRVLLTEETDVLVPSRLISDASLRLSEVEGIEEQIKNQWRDSLYEEVLEEYVDASQHLETLKEKYPVVSQSELDISNVRLHTLHLIAWEKGAEQGFSHERVNHDFTSMKQVLLKSVLAEESLRNGEASILLLEDNSMVDRSGTKIPNQMNTDDLFGDRMEKNRVKAETERQERYPDYPLREILLSKETRHHDGGGTRYFVQMLFVNVPLERVGDEKEKHAYRVDAQNLKYQDIVEKLESGSPDIHYDSAQSGLKHSYSMKNIGINWWPKTERRNDTSLSISINGKGGQNITIMEEGASTKIKFADQPVRELPYLGLRDLFKSNDTVYFVVSPDLLSEMKNNQIPILFSEGGRDPFFIRFVSSTVAPAIKQNIQEQVMRDYLEKDNSVLQEFKKTYWDPVLSTLTEAQSQALIRLALFIQSRSCIHSVPPILLLNHDLFRKLVPEISPEKWEDKVYLKGIEKKLIDSMAMTLPEVLDQLNLFNEGSPNTIPLTDAYYPNLLKLFRAFERKGAVLPFKLTEMLGFLQRVEYKDPWNGDALFRVAAGLFVEEKTQTPPSHESGERESPSQDPIRDSREQAINDAKAVGNILRESVKGLYSPLLNEALLPTNQPLQSLLGGRGVEKEMVFDRIMRFQKDPAYVRPFNEALKSELEESGIFRDAHLERKQARVVSLNRDNFASVQADVSLRDTLNKILQGFGMRDQEHPLFMTIVIPTSHEAGEEINQLRGGEFLGTYVAHPQLDPGETLTIPKIAKAYGDLIDQGLIGPDISLVPVNKMENLDTASLMKSYSTSLENKVKSMAATAKDLPELKRMTQEIKSFLEVMKAIMGMA